MRAELSSFLPCQHKGAGTCEPEPAACRSWDEQSPTASEAAGTEQLLQPCELSFSSRRAPRQGQLCHLQTLQTQPSSEPTPGQPREGRANPATLWVVLRLCCSHLCPALGTAPGTSGLAKPD